MTAPTRPPSTTVDPRPKIVSLELASGSVMPCGTSRGAAAARSTPYALDSTSEPRAQG